MTQPNDESIPKAVETKSPTDDDIMRAVDTTHPTDDDILKAVKAAYIYRYSNIERFLVTSITRDVFDIIIVGVKYYRKAFTVEDEMDELCLVRTNLAVDIFKTDQTLAYALRDISKSFEAKLAKQLDDKLKSINYVKTIIEHFSDKRILGALFAVISLFAIVASLFFKLENPASLAIIAAIASGAAGTYLGINIPTKPDQVGG